MLILLVVTIFLYHGDPQIQTVIAPSADACQAAGLALKADLEKQDKIKDVEWGCFGVQEREKT